MKAQNKSGFCHNLIICCEIYQFAIHQSVVIPILKLGRRNLMYNSSIIIATHMPYNYFPCVKGRSINNIRKYLPIFRATLITVCCLCSYICTVVLEVGNRVWFYSDKIFVIHCTYVYSGITLLGCTFIRHITVNVSMGNFNYDNVVI